MASDAVLRRLARIGQGSITAGQGLLALGALLRGAAAATASPPLPQVAVNAFIWETYLEEEHFSFFAEFAPPKSPVKRGSRGAQAGLARQEGGAAAVDATAIREQVHREVAATIEQARGGLGVG